MKIINSKYILLTKRKKSIASLVILLMMMINSIFLIPDIKEFFWGGSNYVFADFIVLNGIYPFLITVILLLILLISKKINLLLLSILLTLSFIWMFSGRIIAINKYDNNCELISGWFYVGTNFMNTRKLDKDDEMESKLKFKYLKFWRLEIEKDNFKEVVYVGPFLWEKMKHQYPATDNLSNDSNSTTNSFK